MVYCPTINQLLPADRQVRTLALEGSFRKFIYCVDAPSFSLITEAGFQLTGNGPVLANTYLLRYLKNYIGITFDHSEDEQNCYLYLLHVEYKVDFKL